MSREDLPHCKNCGNFINDCNCACPYCGETVKCNCCVGIDKAAGGR